MNFTGTIVPRAKVGTPYSAMLAVSGGVAPITFSLLAGTLPAGLALHLATGEVSGTPTTAGTKTGIRFKATDANGDVCQSAQPGATVVVAA
jgi:hypothetical protein